MCLQALFLSGHTRNVTISNSSFSYIGDNAMAAWGYTDDLKTSPASNQLPEGTGIDGRDGRQPRYTSVLSNIVREIGINERQSSAYSEAKACLSTVRGNLFFNMPRAAINKNDGCELIRSSTGTHTVSCGASHRIAWQGSSSTERGVDAAVTFLSSLG